MTDQHEHQWQDVTTVDEYATRRVFVCSVCGDRHEAASDLYPGEKAAILSPRGHIWKADDDGTVDFFALDVEDFESFGGHNGPRCTVCGFSYCVHCHQDGPPKGCAGPTVPR